MSRAKLTLRAKLFTAAVRSQRITAAVIESGEELEAEIKLLMTNSTPSGKTFRKGRILKALSARSAPGLKQITNKKGKQQVIAGYKFGRRSKKGEPPAVQTGFLRNSVRNKPLGVAKTQVRAGARYAARLDDPKGLDRPFFMSTARKFQKRFQRKIDEAINELL